MNDLRAAYAAGYRAPLLCMPTGGGKTATASVIVRMAVEKGRHVWFLAHLREILAATSAKLTAEGIEHGHIMAGRPDTDAPVQLVMVQTAARRLGRYRKPDLIVVDEAHLAVADTYQRVINDAGRPHLLGLSATPERLDSRGLSEMFDHLVLAGSTADLIAEGLLVPVRYYAPSRPDLTGVRTVAGDYSQGDLADVMDKPTVTGDAVAHYRKLAHGKPAVAFCTNVKHAQHTAAAFTQAGYRAVAISGTSDQDERDAALRGLANGTIDVVVNCQLWVAGVDCPAIGCIILLAPTKSLTKYLQSVGRGLRTHPGKTECIVLDHAGNAFTHGLPTEAREWSLDGAPKRSRGPSDAEPVRQCERCFYVFKPAQVCPSCGHVHPVKERQIKQEDGDLAELLEVKRKQRQEVGRAQTIEELTRIARERNYSMGWVYHQMRIKQQKGWRV